MSRQAWAAALAVLSLSFAACSDDDDSANESALRLSVTDAPVDGAREVVVSFTGVEVKPAEGAAVSLDFAEPVSVDLLATRGGQAFVLIDEEGLDAGSYNWVRLKVLSDRATTDSYITLDDGSQHPLYVPSGSESGLKLNHPFTIPEDEIRALVVDFDLRHSIVDPQGDDAYMLKPVLRVVDEDEVGVIAGMIDPDLLDGELCSADPATGDGAAVYVYADAETVPGDYGGANEPLASAFVRLDEDEGGFGYHLGWLPTGSYTIAYTCQAEADDPETADPLVFSAVETDVDVVAGQTTEVDLEPPLE